MISKSERQKVRRGELIGAGLCTDCARPRGNTPYRCVVCADKARDRALRYARRRTEYRRSAGLCVSCGGVGEEGRQRCGRCSASAAKRARSRESRMRLQGLCPCGGLIAGGRSRCQSCLDKQILRQAKRQEAARRDGQCASCYKVPATPGKRSCEECRQRIAERRRTDPDFRRVIRERLAALRDAVYGHYGGYRCSCCSETEPLFLTIDHIDSKGNVHRRETGCGSGSTFYRWLIKNDFPEGFQVLCFNCNVGKHRNGGVCPHQSKPMELENITPLEATR